MASAIDKDERRAAAIVAKEAQPSFFEGLYAARDADAQVIDDGIFLGSSNASKDAKAMQKRKITHVLIAHPQLPELHPKLFKYKRIPLMDVPEANLLEQLPDALEFLGSARGSGGGVFVCCAKGISRSSSIVIALLMIERGITFQEAWDFCEKRRPIVYPNVGFQQQLKHLDLFVQALDPKLSWKAKIGQLREVVPKGDLSGPQSALKIRERISEIVGEALEDLEKLAAKVCCQPQLLQKRETWKRHGLFFENLHKYKALPSSDEVLILARKASSTLKSLSNIFSDSLKGVQLALAAGKELDSWVSFAEPVLNNPLLNPRKETQDKVTVPVSKGENKFNSEEDEDPMKEFLAKEKNMKDKKKDQTDKKSKKDKSKKDKRNRSDSEETPKSQKMIEAEKKATKAVAKLEKAANKAAKLAKSSRLQAETFAEKARETEREIQRIEVEEAKARAISRREDPNRRKMQRSRSRSSGSRGKSAKKYKRYS